MKAKWTALAWCGLPVAWPGAGPRQGQPTLGIPKPDLLLFGSVTHAAGGLPLPPTTVTWQIASGPDLVTVQGTVVGVNGIGLISPVAFIGERVHQVSGIVAVRR